MDDAGFRQVGQSPEGSANRSRRVAEVGAQRNEGGIHSAVLG
jgi:hypothetical protein